MKNNPRKIILVSLLLAVLNACSSLNTAENKKVEFTRTPSSMFAIPQFECNLDEDKDMRFAVFMNGQTKMVGKKSELVTRRDQRKFLDAYAGEDVKSILLDYSSEESEDKTGCSIVFETANFNIYFKTKDFTGKDSLYSIKGLLKKQSGEEKALSCISYPAIPEFYKSQGCTSQGYPTQF